MFYLKLNKNLVTSQFMNKIFFNFYTNVKNFEDKSQNKNHVKKKLLNIFNPSNKESIKITSVNF